MLYERSVPALDTSAAAAARARLDTLTKPPGSLGYLEEVAVRLAAISAQPLPPLTRPLILVAAADHGVTAEGVSPYPQAVTAQMVANYLRGGAAVNALARSAGAELLVVDAGVAAELPPHPALRSLKIGAGTANLRREAALTEAQTVQALEAGRALAHELADGGVDLLALGEMGIGNTTAAACLTCAYTGATPEQATGRGTGLDDAGLAHKRVVVAEALARARSDPAEPLRTLAELGGFEIALLAGAAIGAAQRRVPVLLDGYITAAAALAAAALAPGAEQFMVAAHRSAEPGHRLALAQLGLRPLLELDLRLGEGSGAALAIPLLRGALACLREMATFGEAGVTDRDAS